MIIYSNIHNSLCYVSNRNNDKQRMMFVRILAIDIGGTAIKMGICDQDGIIEQFHEFGSKSDEGGPYIVRKIQQEIHSRHTDFQAIGISTAGQVDSETGAIIYANENIPNYTGTNLKEILEAEFQVPVKVENDVNAAAIGEKHFGSAQQCNDFICLTYGTGIGGAVIINSKIYKGHSGIAGEFGHIILHPHGRQCNCGKKGCYEQYASTTAIVREAQKITSKYNSGKKIFQYVNTDPALQQVLQEWIQNVSLGLVSFIHIFNPPLIVLGGGIMEQESLVKMIEKEVKKQVMDSFSHVKIVGASLGNQAGILGAASLHLS